MWMRIPRTVEEEKLRQLEIINAQLNPGPALLKFFFWAFVVLVVVFGGFGLLVQLTRP
jgi:hypothetical protein